jgi:hypothetical protein
MNRPALGWGAVLLLLGLLMLADSAGVRLPGGARPLEFFWPVVLILLGGWVILGALRRDRAKIGEASIDLQGATQADVRISHGAGELHIAGGAPADQLASGIFAGGLESSSRKEGERLSVRMNPPSPPLAFFSGTRGNDWDLRLNSEIPMALNLQTGADQARVDLSSIRVTELKVSTGASQTDITLPGRGRSRAEFGLGAASLTIRVPAGVAARIRVSQGVSDVKIDQARFPRTGGGYQSSDYETAENAVDVKIEAGAAEIRVG